MMKVSKLGYTLISGASKGGYTLIELLVVISITAVLSLIGFVNYRSFTTEQAVSKTSSDLQNMLRLVQNNASTSTFCSDKLATGPWKIVFDQASATLTCGSENVVEKTDTFDNVEVSSIRGSSCGADSTLPVSITFVSIAGNLVFESSGASSACLASQSWVITVRNTKDTSKTRSFTLSKGGAVDVL